VEKKITRQTTIQEIFDRYPDKAYHLAMIMADAGLHCVGCHASVFESLEQGMLAHGMTDEQIDPLIEQLNSEIESTKPAISLTEKAAEKVREIQKSARRENWGLQINLDSGNRAEFNLKQNPSAGENEIDANGIRIFISSEMLGKITGSEIDYVEGEKSGFKLVKAAAA